MNHYSDQNLIMFGLHVAVSHKPSPFLLAFFCSYVSFSILHILFIGQRVRLNGTPPWPVKRTSAPNVMRAIHLEKRRVEDK